jgi:hypothetical protein
LKKTSKILTKIHAVEALGKAWFIWHIYHDKFADDLYAKIIEMRRWSNIQTYKADLRAYLMAEDPYSAKR